MNNMIKYLIFIADTTGKMKGYNMGKEFGDWIPFIVFATIATIILVKKRKSWMYLKYFFQIEVWEQRRMLFEKYNSVHLNSYKKRDNYNLDFV